MFKTLYFYEPGSLNPQAIKLAQHPEVSLAIWRRPALPELVSFLQVYVLAGGADICFESSLDQLDQTVINALIQAGASRDPDWVLLHAEIAKLGQVFAALTSARAMRIELNIVTGPHCTRFHADYNLSRLLCTYVGPGTQWTSHKNVNWSQGDTPARVLGVYDESRVQQLECSEVAWLKGRLHHDVQGYGQVHRSPDLPIGQPFRILLKFDQI